MLRHVWGRLSDIALKRVNGENTKEYAPGSDFLQEAKEDRPDSGRLYFLSSSLKRFVD